MALLLSYSTLLLGMKGLKGSHWVDRFMIRREQLPNERTGGSRKGLPRWGKGLNPAASLSCRAGLFVTIDS